MKIGDLVSIVEEDSTGYFYLGVVRELDYEKSGYVRVYWKHIDSYGLYHPKHLVIIKSPDQIIKDIV